MSYLANISVTLIILSL